MSLFSRRRHSLSLSWHSPRDSISLFFFFSSMAMVHYYHPPSKRYYSRVHAGGGNRLAHRTRSFSPVTIDRASKSLEKSTRGEERGIAAAIAIAGWFSDQKSRPPPPPRIDSKRKHDRKEKCTHDVHIYIIFIVYRYLSIDVHIVLLA